jgi:hypothetical protein
LGPVVVGFAASPGGFADSGPAPSRFVDTLAREIMSPDRRELSEVVTRVSKTVATATGGRMRPSYVRSGPIHFRNGRSFARRD